MKTINTLLIEGKSLLKDSVDTPDLDASLLLADALGCSRTQLLRAVSESVSEESEIIYKNALERRLSGECVAYIVGYKEFWGLRLAVNSAVLTPRPDTETLVEATLAVADANDARSCLDLCAGSGAVAIALKHERPHLVVTGSDISKSAVDVARANAEAHHVYVQWIESDLFDRIEGCFDIIVSNPPYIPTSMIAGLAPEVRKEPRLALDGGADGLDIIKKIIVEAKTRLNQGGALLMEADPRQMPAVTELLRENTYQAIRTYKDLSGCERAIGGIYKWQVL
ncbi:MAG: peptide chain release factor N(5)-glutamine methyltransferase [Treponema sp.]|jgi:release factor glutamine methyltransferase|nr:peptide chain release factor N(5)-glutamine methyltransferase [Treponema sp.]